MSKQLPILGCLLLFPFGAVAKPLLIEVNAGGHDRAEGSPLICDLPVGLNEAGSARLFPLPKPKSDPPSIPAQVVPGGKTRLIWILDRPLKAGTTQRYELDLRPPAAETEQPVRPTDLMNCLETGSVIEILSGARPILQYIKAPTAAAEKNEPCYSRSGYIHPLTSPAGTTITGDYAEDHPHQHGLFFAWTNTTFEGRDINFWDQKSETAQIVYDKTVKTQSGPVFAQFAVMQRHEDLTAPGGPKPVLNERWLVRAYRTGSGSFLVDIHSTQTCASDSPLTINQYHYGGMAIRGADPWFVNDKEAEQPSDFLTSGGKNRTNGNHTRPDWVALHGSPDGKAAAGVAIFGHPENFRAPQPVRLHPHKPYFVFTPQVESGFAIEPGTPYVSRYRYLIFDGEPDAKLLEQIWHDYSQPIEISLVTDP